MRHARAKTISLTLVETADELHLEIVDDGIGFDNSSKTGRDGSNGHYGLQGMAERAALSDASFKVESQLGEGTAIAVILRQKSLVPTLVQSTLENLDKGGQNFSGHF